jgi:hypothetical protein
MQAPGVVRNMPADRFQPRLPGDAQVRGEANRKFRSGAPLRNFAG